MKRVVVAIILCCLFTVSARAESYVFEQVESGSDISSGILSDIGAGSIELPYSVSSQLGTDDISDIKSLADVLSGDGLLKIWNSIKDRILSPLKFTALTLSAVFISALISGAQSFGKSKKAVEMIISLIFVSVCAPYTVGVISRCAEAIGDIGVFMYSFIPVFIGILAASMRSGLAAGVSPSLFLSAQAISFFSGNIIVPLCSAGLAVGISSGLCGERMSGLTAGLKKTVIFILSLLVSVFLAILSLKAAVYSSADTVGLKTAKFLSGSFIPIVGSSVSEMLSRMAACFSAVRSTVGIFGVIAVLLILLPCAVELTAFRMCASVCAFACELFDRTGALKMMRAFCDTLSIMLAVVTVCGVVCIFSVTIITIGGGSV